MHLSVIIFVDARTWLADFQQQLTRLKQVGDELKSNLTIFEASFVDSEELDKIDRVIIDYHFLFF